MTIDLDNLLLMCKGRHCIWLPEPTFHSDGVIRFHITTNQSLHALGDGLIGYASESAWKNRKTIAREMICRGNNTEHSILSLRSTVATEKTETATNEEQIKGKRANHYHSLALATGLLAPSFNSYASAIPFLSNIGEAIYSEKIIDFNIDSLTSLGWTIISILTPTPGRSVARLLVGIPSDFDHHFSRKGCCSPGYIDGGSIVLVVGTDYYSSGLDRFTKVQKIHFQMPDPFRRLLVLMQDKLVHGSPIYQAYDGHGLDEAVGFLRKILGIKIDAAQFTELHHAYYYGAEIRAKIKLPELSVMGGRPVGDWRAASNYYKTNQTHITDCHKRIVTQLCKDADVAIKW